MDASYTSRRMTRRIDVPRGNVGETLSGGRPIATSFPAVTKQQSGRYFPVAVRVRFGREIKGE